MSYESLRWFADTWGLVFLAVIFLSLIAWLFRRGSNKTYDHAARIPMEVDENPSKTELRNYDPEAHDQAAKGDKP
ncbi:MAG: cbb3-type cytochrome c oxidase subunit 3 [Pseudomonadota bacterium]